MRGGNRGTNNSTRFDMDYESKSMYEGIAEDLGGVVGQDVEWFRWQEYWADENFVDIVDDIYDTSSSVSGKGRRWMLPFKLPTVMAQLIRSSNVMNERGFYVTDTLRLVVNVGDVQRLIPEMITDPSSHIRDRIIYQGEVYVPTRVLPRGSFGLRWAVVTIDCNQVNPEELINDPQFSKYAQSAVVDNRNTVATLSSMDVKGYTLTPPFSPNVTSYELNVIDSTTSVKITPVASDGINSIITVDETYVRTGLTADVPLIDTVNVIKVDVTASNSSATKSYTLTVTKV